MLGFKSTIFLFVLCVLSFVTPFLLFLINQIIFKFCFISCFCLHVLSLPFSFPFPPSFPLPPSFFLPPSISQISPFYKDTSQIRLGPILITSLNLITSIEILSSDNSGVLGVRTSTYESRSAEREFTHNMASCFLYIFKNSQLLISVIVSVSSSSSPLGTQISMYIRSRCVPNAFFLVVSEFSIFYFSLCFLLDILLTSLVIH